MEIPKVPKLTAKQQDVLTILSKCIEESGKAPTITELAQLLNVSSFRTVTQHLETLQRKGFINRLPNQRRGIELIEQKIAGSTTVILQVVSSVGCDNLSVYAEPNYDEQITLDKSFLQGRHKDDVMVFRAKGDSMLDAGVKDGDLILTEKTPEAQDGDQVVAILDGLAVLKQIKFLNDAVVLSPMSKDPIYQPIIMRKDFEIFGKKIDIIRSWNNNEITYVNIEQN